MARHTRYHPAAEDQHRTGVAFSLGLTRLISGLLFGVSATDPITFVAITVALMAVCVVAGGVPARRASRVNAIVALRGE